MKTAPQLIDTLCDASPVAGAARPRRGLRVTTTGLAVLAFGLLLWARFILVTGHPKTAYAEPDSPALLISPANAEQQVAVDHAGE